MLEGGNTPTPASHATSDGSTASGPAAPTGSVSTIVLAAGEGTRMRSATPKVLHRVAGRSLVEHAVRAAAGTGPEHLAVVVGHGREQVAEHLDEVAGRLGRKITVAVQEQQHGTGHAVGCALAALPADLTGTVLVSYGDVPLLDAATLTALLAEHSQAGNAVTVLTAVVTDPTGYGRVLRDPQSGAVREIVEQKDATPEQLAVTEINSGVYAFDAAVLAAGLTQLSTDNAQGELYLTDVLGIARAAGHRVGALICGDPWLVEGVNDRVQLARLGAELNRRLVERWMRDGVTVVDPATTWLDVDVELARDVLVEPGVQLRGGTVVGEGAVIGPDTTLTDCRIGAGASVVRTHGSGAVIGERASVGPFAYLRPGTVLGERGKIGTFVEVKNSEIGTASKVPHLSYVGDATIGEHTNIGAASVFVNYDGVAKHRSVVGSHCRTGSDNMFVAPVTVGDGAYTGAGTVLRRDVPPGALAVSGGPQRNLEGWVINRRPGTPAAEAAQRALAVEGQPAVGEVANDGKGR
ncbi:bifunctional UDP-N-acetylglucosamine diphosphorylase/glucosamine-1-phosphate N-acetyltransferase GlmU [Goodfellowiella coeruleoviolacea]|uniref:Bifunctional protein GlmU n=1 Tax=Goodfellowiella coeruleoviolacea TaxID=334858 RepID=A0AAE3GIE9_9PSEU|nr:bifunctional UDP-N-acetylglucosamine diphosphorylase/glucosamine-1-phosphate N-acetyltransferase GlmU [Goodfellowiella coeruleoviolacea]MCP2168761.1 bifunctional UDP-N-acetylglucosamine pyrophosphorylase / Glucosamine-1-phosphate N-acetyltransferase [Goodfellowiella coeruleoviolacea]